jgi:release factor glutamine methyltransferase
MSAPETESAVSLDGGALSGVAARLRAAGCVFAEEEARLLVAAASSPAEIASAVERRVAGYPLEHILGWAQFCGLRIELDAGVFVPRRRTELLVNEAAALLSADLPPNGRFQKGLPRERRDGVEPAVVVDLCCGSGAVGVAIASRIEGLELHAADIDPAAVDCARRNLARVGGEVHHGDLFGALPPAIKGRVRVLAVNAPYVPTGAIDTMPHEAREHEPLLSLDGGADGLDFHHRVAEEAAAWLQPGGNLIIETSERQAGRTAAILKRAGFAVRTVHSDELDGTVVVGRAR